MKELLVAFLLAAVCGPLWAQTASKPTSPPLSATDPDGLLGLGVVLGQPIGGSMKYWMSGTQALDVQIGAANGDNTVIYGDYLWTAWDMFPQPDRGRLGAYVGAGPRLETESVGDAEFGIRTIAGLDYWVAGHPIELFFEGGPVFQLSPSGTVDADIGAGVRFYLGHK